MSLIIDYGENLVLDQQVSVAQTKTQAGRRVAQKRGPTLYNLEVQVPAQKMNSDKFYAIENEVIDLAYGANDFQDANLTGKIGGGFTEPRGTWGGTPVVDGADQTGLTIAVKDISGTVMPFDYVQFKGSTKVYQLAAGSTNTSLKLNSPLVVSPGNETVVVFGNDVSFNFAMMSKPSTNYQPGGIVMYGTFQFEEVIRDEDRGE